MAPDAGQSVGDSVVMLPLISRSGFALASRASASKPALILARSSLDSSSRSRSPLCAPSIARISSSSFSCIAALSLFWVFWIRNTITNVMMVVAVFMTSCQVLSNPNIGPVAAQTRRMRTAAIKVAG